MKELSLEQKLAKFEEVAKEAEKIRKLDHERDKAFHAQGYNGAGQISLKREIDKTSTELLMAKALELRLAGFSYAKIAEAIQVSLSTAQKYCKDALQLSLHENIDSARTLEIERLDSYLKRLQPLIEANDLQALDRALKIHERKSKLQGLEFRPADNPATVDDATKKLAQKYGISEAEAAEYIKAGQQMVS